MPSNALADLVMERLGQRTDLSAAVRAEMQIAQYDLEGTEPLLWFNINTWIHDGFDNAWPEANLPGDWVKLCNDLVWISHIDGVAVEPIVLAGAPRQYMTTIVPGQIVNFAEVGTTLVVSPPPDKKYTVKALYYRRQPALRFDGDDNGWTTHAPDLLIAKTGLEVAKSIRDYEAAERFSKDLAAARARLFVLNVAKEEATRKALLRDA